MDNEAWRDAVIASFGRCMLISLLAVDAAKVAHPIEESTTRTPYGTAHNAAVVSSAAAGRTQTNSPKHSADPALCVLVWQVLLSDLILSCLILSYLALAGALPHADGQDGPRCLL